MSIIAIDYKSRLPIYEQLVANIKKLALTGALPPDSQLPSVRQLSSDLGINPNTVQKAYATLEQQGVIYSVPGRGSFIASDVSALRSGYVDELYGLLDQAVNQLAQAGVPAREVVRRVELLYERVGRHD